MRKFLKFISLLLVCGIMSQFYTLTSFAAETIIVVNNVADSLGVVKADIENVTINPIDCKVVIGGYNAKGELITCVTENVRINGNTKVNFTKNIANRDNVTHFKIVVYDVSNGNVPLGESAKFQAEIRPLHTSEDLGDGTFANPVLNADYSDPDVERYNGKYYMVASTFHLAPGAVILESTDLVNWKVINNAFANVYVN